MDTITNTNHNAWTFTVHVAESLNKAAGKADKKIYGDSIQIVEPTPKTSLGSTLAEIGVLLLTIIVLMVWIWKLDNVKKRIFRK